jgi:hypothetical protein
MMQLYSDFGTMLVNGFNQFMQAGNKLIIRETYLAGDNLSPRMVYCSDLDDDKSHTTSGALLVVILYALGDTAIFSSKIRRYGGHHHPVLQFQLPDSAGLK